MLIFFKGQRNRCKTSVTFKYTDGITCHVDINGLEGNGESGVKDDEEG